MHPTPSRISSNLLMSGRRTQLFTPSKEVFITSKTVEFHIDRDVEDIAFVFRAFDLFRRAATLQGINCVFVL